MRIIVNSHFKHADYAHIETYMSFSFETDRIHLWNIARIHM